MGLSLSIFFLTVGAILVFAVSTEVEGVNLQAIGWILIVVGALAGLFSAIFWSTWGGSSRNDPQRGLDRDRV